MVPNRTHDKGPYHVISSISRTGNFTPWMQFQFKKIIPDGRHHRHALDLCMQSQIAIAAHILDLVIRNQPASEGDTHDGSTPSVKMTRPFKTFGPSSCFMTRHLLCLTPQGCLAAYGYLSDTGWGLTKMASPTMSKQTCLWGKFSSAVRDLNQ